MVVKFRIMEVFDYNLCPILMPVDASEREKRRKGKSMIYLFSPKGLSTLYLRLHVSTTGTRPALIMFAAVLLPWQ